MLVNYPNKFNLLARPSRHFLEAMLLCGGRDSTRVCVWRYVLKLLTCTRICFSIDATTESGRLGRLVNHSRQHPNLQTKVITLKEWPRLILVALKDINEGEELLYDYGDRSRESLRAHPWLAL